jgi:hypothetical protein
VTEQLLDLEFTSTTHGHPDGTPYRWRSLGVSPEEAQKTIDMNNRQPNPPTVKVTPHKERTTMSKKNGKKHGPPEAKPGTEYSTLIQDGGIPRGPEYVDQLAVPVDPEELRAMASELGSKIVAKMAAEEVKKTEMAHHKEIIDGLESRIEELGACVNSATKPADVLCIDVLMPDNSLHVVRLDTGERTGEVKAATAEDLQDELDLDGEQEGART